MTSPTGTQSAPSMTARARSRQFELQRILKQVSRSFYLSLVVLPRSVRPTVSLAYLFCRAADTIADTRLLPASDRLQALHRFRGPFIANALDPEGFSSSCPDLAPHQGSEGERQLMQQLSACFELYAELPVTDRQLVRDLVLTLTQGMEMDLTHFSSASVDKPRALPDAAALDRYTYFVAGVVGVFWTKIHAIYLPALRRLNLEHLCHLGIRFGKGLQMTNILKDLGRDLQQGRCYLPQSKLTEHGLSVGALMQGGGRQRLQPVLDPLIYETLAHLDEARAYIVALPWRCIRLRLSCMWPLLFAVQTLEVINTAEDLLDPQARVKISRAAVYLTMAQSVGGLISRRYFERYYNRLCQRLLSGMDSGPATNMAFY